MERALGDNRLVAVAAAIGAAAAVLVLVPWSPHTIWVALAAVVAGLVLINRRFALLLIPPAIALSPEIPVAGLPIRIEDAVMMVLGLGWLAKLMVFQERRSSPIDRLLFAYVGAAVVAILWGVVIGTVTILSTNQLYSAPLHLLKRIEFVLLFLILVDTLTTVDDVRRYTYVLIASLLGLNVFALVEFLANQHLALAPAGAPVHEPGLAAMLNIALAFGLMPAVRAPGRILLGLIMVFSMGVLPLALGRNFVATTVLMSLYVGVFWHRWVLAMLPVPWFVAKFIFPEHIIARYLTFRYAFAPDISGFETQGASLVSRVIPPGYHALLALGYSPVIGFGLAARPLGFIDSEYATQLFYTGLVGLAIFIILGVRLFRMASEARRAAADPMAAGLARALQLALICYAIFSIFSPSISAARGGGLFFLIIGLLAVLHRAVLTDAAQRGVG